MTEIMTDDELRQALAEVREAYRVIEERQSAIEFVTSCALCHFSYWHAANCPLHPRWTVLDNPGMLIISTC